jgi:hypothetical protein
VADGTVHGSIEGVAVLVKNGRQWLRMASVTQEGR